MAAEKKIVRAVVVGGGAIAQRRHLPEYVSNPNAEVAGIVDFNAERAKELAERFGMDADKWSYLLSPSAFTSEHLCSAFGLARERRAQVVCEEGYPRNDAVVNTLAAPDAAERVARIKERLGVPADKKLLLFAPTWRDDQFRAGTGYVAELPLDLA